jgi:hypothetical protein
MKNESGATDSGQRYRSIKINSKTLERFDQSGATFIHRGTRMLFRRDGNKLRSLSDKGITVREYQRSRPARKMDEVQ